MEGEVEGRRGGEGRGVLEGDGGWEREGWERRGKCSEDERSWDSGNGEVG